MRFVQVGYKEIIEFIDIFTIDIFKHRKEHVWERDEIKYYRVISNYRGITLI